MQHEIKRLILFPDEANLVGNFSVESVALTLLLEVTKSFSYDPPSLSTAWLVIAWDLRPCFAPNKSGLPSIVSWTATFYLPYPFSSHEAESLYINNMLIFQDDTALCLWNVPRPITGLRRTVIVFPFFSVMME